MSPTRRHLIAGAIATAIAARTASAAPLEVPNMTTSVLVFVRKHGPTHTVGIENGELTSLMTHPRHYRDSQHIRRWPQDAVIEREVMSHIAAISAILEACDPFAA